MRLSRKLQLAFGGLLLFMAAASLFGIHQLNQSLATYATTVQAANHNERAVRNLLVKFKSQTQEWKNTLLRGKDAKEREKYWSAFQKVEGEMVADARQLIAHSMRAPAKSAFDPKSVELNFFFSQGSERGLAHA